MNSPPTHHNDRLLLWIGLTLGLMLFGLGDAAIVAWSASLATFGQIAAAATAFVLVSTGLFFTVWKIRR